MAHLRRCWLLWLVVPLLGGCQGWRLPGAGLGAGPGTRKSTPPLPEAHPAVAALPVTPFEVAAYGLAGEFPTTWTLPTYYPDPNSVVQLRQGADTYFSIGFLPGMRPLFLANASDVPPEAVDELLLEHAAQGVALADNYFLGARKTVLSYSRVLFGEHEVLTVTMLIRRPVGTMDQMPDEDWEQLRLMQQHYLELAPEGSRRLSRHYLWILGDDVWIGQVVAPPSSFLQRTTEVEERILPSLRFSERPVAAPATTSQGD